jgi:hypothetical protein
VTDPSPSRPDHALLSALAEWGGGPAVLARLAPPWRERLEQGHLRHQPTETARHWLCRELEAELRADLTRVHPSWWVRPLQGESPTVRRAVAAFAPEAIRERLRSELDLRRDDLVVSSPPHPEAISCVLALWAEPFAGGPPACEDDPPVILTLATLSRHELTRLLALAGLAKLAAVGDRSEPIPSSPRVRGRLERFWAAWEGLPADLAAVAARDVERHEGRVLSHLPRLGLVTLARLLAPVDPHRSRWALQHLPYPTARFVRSEMDAAPAGGDDRRVVEWESRLWAMAREQLAAEQEAGGP